MSQILIRITTALLGKLYFKRNIPVVDKRLQMGGVRGDALGGLKTFNVEMPDRGISSRVRGFFMLPQRIGSALWIPSGSSLLILVTLVSWRYWRELEPLDGPCEQSD